MAKQIKKKILSSKDRKKISANEVERLIRKAVKEAKKE
ncbi:MAG: hypothetical protein SCARUB_01198 [Candidatus Scalindua rubra]|uniref:Uncharacterized protein n=1 Tax=Candidatus Scalindua rubra TaxID=1872076 RepID=A0A1E3XDK0_9BACT|nr:MAG: hypothetical protein SCARUB_01198 [Candidatus Scalindua rubra]